MRFRLSRSSGRSRSQGRPAVPAALPDRWSPLAVLCQELGRALELQETAHRVIVGCAGQWPVDGAHSAEGAPVVTELLRISNRIGDLHVLEQDAELKEDACYLVLYHQAAVDRALRLAYTADACEASESERTALCGLGAPAEQLRKLHEEVSQMLQRHAPEPAVTARSAASPAAPLPVVRPA